MLLFSKITFFIKMFVKLMYFFSIKKMFDYFLKILERYFITRYFEMTNVSDHFEIKCILPTTWIEGC